MRPKRLPRLWCALQGVLPLGLAGGGGRDRASGARNGWPREMRTGAGRGAELALRLPADRRTLRPMDLFEIKAEIPAGAVDATDNVLLELGVEGWSVLEDAIQRRAWLVGIFPSGDELEERWSELQPLLPQPIVDGPTRRALGDRDWRDSYKAHFKAWQFGRLHWVPEWERPTFVLPPGDSVLWLDPGLAFGTGNHETTRLCVERLVAIAGEAGGAANMADVRVIDAGCGSGILALSAALLGFGQVTGFDNDPEAVRVSQENAAANALEQRVSFTLGDLSTGFAGGPFDVVLANILGHVLARFARELTVAVAPGGRLILSGILAAECDEVRAAFSAVAPGWTQESRTMGEWSDVLLTRPR